MILKFFGLRKEGKHVRHRTCIIIFLLIYSFIQCVLSMKKRWDDLELRYLAMEDTNQFFFSSLILTEFCIVPDNVMTLLTITDSTYFEYTSGLPKSIHEFKNKSEEGMKSRLNRFTALMLVFFSSILFPPFFQTMYIFYCGKQVEYSNKSLPSPYENWYPFETNKLYIYLLLYSQNLFVGIVATCTAISNLGVSVTSLNHLATEIHLLSLSIINIDDIVSNSVYWCKNSVADVAGHHNAGDRSKQDDRSKGSSKGMVKSFSGIDNEVIYEKRLRLFTKDLIQHHISIIR